MEYEIKIKPDGEHELDLEHVWQDVEMYTNVTVVISRCIHCGETTIGWIRQDNTEQILGEEEI